MPNVLKGIVYNIDMYINPDLVARILFQDAFGVEVRPYTKGLMSPSRQMTTDTKLKALYTFGFDAIIKSTEESFGIKTNSFVRRQVVKGQFLQETTTPMIIEVEVRGITHSSLFNDIATQSGFPVQLNNIALSNYAALAIMLDTDDKMKTAPANLRGANGGWGILSSFSLVVGSVVA